MTPHETESAGVSGPPSNSGMQRTRSRVSLVNHDLCAPLTQSVRVLKMAEHHRQTNLSAMRFSMNKHLDSDYDARATV